MAGQGSLKLMFRCFHNFLSRDIKKGCSSIFFVKKGTKLPVRWSNVFKNKTTHLLRASSMLLYSSLMNFIELFVVVKLSSISVFKFLISTRAPLRTTACKVLSSSEITIPPPLSTRILHPIHSGKNFFFE